ncbi:MAG: GNAT family N-acetyltransferase [Clostridia bacterium]|nr:GNAT family N-acetyltransferase [Clostridia bacterium]
MNNVEYVQISEKNFNVNSLDEFIRFQSVETCWRKSGEDYVLKPVKYIEDWTLKELGKLAERILEETVKDSVAYSAVCEGKIVGFALIQKELFGSEKQYADLAEFYVSQPFRGKGIGKALFKLACKSAKRFGAKKLYISAHSTEDSIAAYKSFGCIPAKEINVTLAEKEPFDLQLEFELN